VLTLSNRKTLPLPYSCPLLTCPLLAADASSMDESQEVMALVNRFKQIDAGNFESKRHRITPPPGDYK
jgi:hypothetical protein